MTEEAQTTEKTLFERIGGMAAVDAAVDKMYDKILADPELTPFFEKLDMAKQRASQKAFVAMAFGGPTNYTGDDLTHAHARLVKYQGLNDKHFDLVAGHLKSALEELNVPVELVNEVLTVVGTTREAVLGRAA